MIRTALFLLLGVALMANHCDSQNIQQGLAGKVLWIAGDQMPGIIDPRKQETSRKAPAPKGIEREVYIYELTNTQQAKGNGFFYEEVQTPLAEKVKTDKEGNFAVALPPGRYSVFIKEEEGLFANLMDGEGNIHPVEVLPDSVTQLTIEVNYKAAY